MRWFEENTGPHRFSSTQVELPVHLAHELLAVGRSIDPADIHEEGTEDEPHITLRYGLHTSNHEEVRPLLAAEKPVVIRLGELSLFTGAGRPDVLKIDVHSPDLHHINKLLKRKLDCTDTHPTYVPHATVAYLKPGKGKRYVGPCSLTGKSFIAPFVTFSSPGNGRVPLSLGGGPADVRALADSILLGVPSRIVVEVCRL